MEATTDQALAASLEVIVRGDKTTLVMCLERLLRGGTGLSSGGLVRSCMCVLSVDSFISIFILCFHDLHSKCCVGSTIQCGI